MWHCILFFRIMHKTNNSRYYDHWFIEYKTGYHFHEHDACEEYMEIFAAKNCHESYLYPKLQQILRRVLASVTALWHVNFLWYYILSISSSNLQVKKYFYVHIYDENC